MTLQSFGEELGVCVALQNLCLQELGRVLENLHRGKRARSPRTFLESLHGAWDPGWESNAVFGQLSERQEDWPPNSFKGMEGSSAATVTSNMAHSGI